MLLNLISIVVLRLKLWFSGFDTTRFRILTYLPIFHVFLVLSHYHVIDSSHITLLEIKIMHNW